MHFFRFVNLHSFCQQGASLIANGCTGMNLPNNASKVDLLLIGKLCLFGILLELQTDPTLWMFEKALEIKTSKNDGN